jgi:hypothetical protein
MFVSWPAPRTSISGNISPRSTERVVGKPAAPPAFSEIDSPEFLDYSLVLPTRKPPALILIVLVKGVRYEESNLSPANQPRNQPSTSKAMDAAAFGNERTGDGYDTDKRERKCHVRQNRDCGKGSRPDAGRGKSLVGPGCYVNSKRRQDAHGEGQEAVRRNNACCNSETSSQSHDARYYHGSGR